MLDMKEFKVLAAYFLGRGVKPQVQTSKDGKRTQITGDGFSIVVTNKNYFLVWVNNYLKKSFRNQLDVCLYLDATAVRQ